jgi:hypothetical protein
MMDLSKEAIVKVLGYQSIDDFIEKLYLQTMIKCYENVSKIPNITTFDENRIKDEFENEILKSNSKLAHLINQRTISFTIENNIRDRHNKRRRTDIGFLVTGIPTGILYVIECKKLSGVSRKAYIDDGISRFTNHVYINENDFYAGICSFVFSKDIDNLVSGIKERVSKHCLVEHINDDKICNYENSFYSKHHKIDNQKITLHHLFFDFNKNK